MSFTIGASPLASTIEHHKTWWYDSDSMVATQVCTPYYIIPVQRVVVVNMFQNDVTYDRGFPIVQAPYYIIPVQRALMIGASPLSKIPIT